MFCETVGVLGKCPDYWGSYFRVILSRNPLYPFLHNPICLSSQLMLCKIARIKVLFKSFALMAAAAISLASLRGRVAYHDPSMVQ